MVKEEMENLIHECIPEVVNSYNWQDEEEDDGCESNEYDWYDSYSHTTGYQAEYEAAHVFLRNHDYDTSDDNCETLLEKCSIRYYY